MGRNSSRSQVDGIWRRIESTCGFDAEGKIYNYSLLSHAETPGLGSKAADWFKEG